MADPEQLPPPPTTSRPKFLGPPPPAYPASGASLAGPGREWQWKARYVVAVAGVSFVLGVWVGNIGDGAGQDGATAPAHPTESLIDEVLGDSPATSSATTATTAAPAPTQVARFTGSGSRPTPTFVVERGWEVRWESPNDDVSIDVYPVSAGTRASSTRSATAGSGSMYQPEAGTFLLGVNASGDWTVTVVQMPPSG